MLVNDHIQCFHYLCGRDIKPIEGVQTLGSLDGPVAQNGAPHSQITQVRHLHVGEYTLMQTPADIK
jgi:hypothetical protein